MRVECNAKLSRLQTKADESSWHGKRYSLPKQGIMTEFKYSRTGGRVEGVKFIKGKHVFSGSKIDRKFSFANIEKRLERNKKFREKYQQTQRTYESQRPTAVPRPQVAQVQREESKPRYEESAVMRI